METQDLYERVAALIAEVGKHPNDFVSLTHSVMDEVRTEVEREIAARLREIAQEWDDRPNPNEASPLLRFAAELEKRNG